MKKKITALLLTTAMFSSVTPLALADEASFKQNLTDLITPYLNTTNKYEFNAAQNNAISPKARIEVPTDIATKEDGASTYGQNASITFNGGVRKFDFEAKMDMSNVRDEFEAYMALARKAATANNEVATLEALPVTGQFTVSITYPTAAYGLNAPAELLTNTGMADFKQKKTDGTPVTIISVFEETAVRTTTPSVDGATATTVITIDVKAGVTAKSLEDNLEEALADIYLYAENGELTKTGTFDIIGTVTGDIKVGSTPIAFVGFDAVQDENIAEEVGATAIDETITAVAPSPSPSTPPSSGGMGGGSSKPSKPSQDKVEIGFKDGDKDHHEIEGILEDGKHVVDLGTIAPPKPEGNKIFGGWYKDKELTQKASGKETVTKDTTFYAGWIDTKHNIGFNVDGEAASVNTGANGSVNVDKDHIVVGEEGVEVKLSDITINGKQVTGWFLDPEMTIPADASVVITEDTIFYASTEEIKVPAQLETDGDHFAYIIGYPEGDVRPENSITREEVATIFFRLLTEASRTANWTETNSFSDVDADRWSNNAISTMAAMGIITGYEDGTFAPEKGITRAEFATIAARFDDSEVTAAGFNDIAEHWAKSYIEKAAGLQWINGYEDGTFKPENKITRAEVMAIVNRMLKRDVSSDYIHADAITWSDNDKAAWYYEDVVEATNSHKFERLTEGGVEERWTEMLENRDWAALEK